MAVLKQRQKPSDYNMDFLLQDDNNDGGGGFVCENCGFTDSYEDGTGKLTCSNCFTQSQGVVYSQEADFDDVAKMGNIRGGNIVLQKKGGEKGGPRTTKKRGRQPLEELDTSKPLPDLITCIQAYQTVLGGCVKRLGVILRLGNNELQAVMETVGSIWRGYVIAWRDGAQKYGAIFPDLRFSLRDLFLTSSYNAKISRVLSLKVSKMVRLEFGSSSNNNNNEDSSPKSTRTTTAGGRKPYKKETSGATTHMPPGGKFSVKGKERKRPLSALQLSYQLEENDKGREEAAIALRPSMRLAAAILWLAVSRIGITTGQIVDWVANGSLPLLNAFAAFFTSNERNNLQSLHNFFCMISPPTADTIENLAAKLAIACGIRSTSDLPQYDSDSSSSDDDMEVSSKKQPTKVVARLRYVPLECIPGMVAQLVANLGLGQRVLDIAMALMGQPSSCRSTDNNTDYSVRKRKLPAQLENADQWLPPPLQRAHPQRIKTLEYALAVIVVACKMCPGWENWTFGRRISHPTTATSGKGGGMAQDFEMTADASSLSSSSPSRRFVPWNEEQFNLLKDESISDYLDFMEETMLNRGSSRQSSLPFPAFSAILDKSCNKKKKKKKEKGSNQLEAPLPHHESTASSIGDGGDGQKMSAGAGAAARETNFSLYISYPSKPYSHNKHLPHSSNQKNFSLTGEAFHKNYSQLVEYISYRAHVAAHKIHEIVVELDEEVVALCGKKKKFKEKKKKKRRKKTKRQGNKEADHTNDLLMQSLSRRGRGPSSGISDSAEI